MTQKRFSDYRSAVIAFNWNMENWGVQTPGRYQGFDTLNILTDTTFTLGHSSAFKPTLIDGSISPNMGALKTNQGVLVLEDDVVGPFSVDENTLSVPIKYYVVAQHGYIQSTSSNPVTYNIIKGPTNGNLPTLTVPALQTIIGVITIARKPAVGNANLNTPGSYWSVYKKTAQGGQLITTPAETDFIRTDLINRIQSLAKGMGDNCILWGVERYDAPDLPGSVLAYGFTEGYVMRAGVLSRFDGQIIPRANYNDHGFSTQSTNSHPQGIVPTTESTSLYTIPKVIMSELMAVHLVSDYEKNRPGKGPWVPVDSYTVSPVSGLLYMTQGWTTGDGVVDGAPIAPTLRFRKDNRRVELSGACSRDTTVIIPDSGIIFTLPTGNRPTRRFEQVVIGRSSLGLHYGRLSINYLGQVKIDAIEPAPTSVAYSFSLSGIIIPLD